MLPSKLLSWPVFYVLADPVCMILSVLLPFPLYSSPSQPVLVLHWACEFPPSAGPVIGLSTLESNLEPR